MQAVEFDRDAMAAWYAEQHLEIDPGVQEVHYLPTGAPSREIRLFEVNRLIAMQTDDALEPLDFGVDRYADTEHKLLVLDVTPSQWQRIQRGSLPLPRHWSLASAVRFAKR